MVHQEIVDFIRKRRASLLTKEQIEAELSSAGWSSVDIAEAFAIVEHTPGSAATLASAVSIAPRLPAKTLFPSLHAPLLVLKQHARAASVFVIGMSIVGFVFLVMNVLSDLVSWGALAFIGAGIVLMIISWFMVAALLVNFSSEQPPGFFGTWRASRGRAWRLFLIYLVYLLLVLGGTLLFVFPGLVFATLFMFAPIYM